MEKAIFDASFFLSFLLPEEQNANLILKKFIENKLTLVEPSIFIFEVVNALKYAFVSRRIEKEKLLKIIKFFQKLENINYVYDFDLEKLTAISLKFNLSIYDSVYVYLKRETGHKLYSLDKKLMKLK